ncbi:MAG: glycosyltransferase family 2 protein [Verrucomicrobia bacterium]|nr:glycosyltransferase family 2 protein [Verrucomicrobiota bacterium]
MSTTREPLVSFVVPLYFTGEGIVKLLDAFRNLAPGGDYEIILVNDGSTDSTLQRAREIIPTMPVKTTLVDMARNFGEHAAVLEGFRHARGRYVVNLDDDLQNPISEALKLVEHLRQTDADVVYSYYEEKKHHWFRNLGSWLTNRMATFLLGKPEDLYLSSFRAMKRELVQRIIRYAGPYPYVDGLILGASNRIERLQVIHEERADGQSGYTLRKLVRLWMNMLFNFSIMPLRVASVLGAFLCGAGLLVLLVVLIEHFFYGVSQTGWGSLMATVSIFSGSQLLILGLLGEYVGRAYMTVSGKPQSVVRELVVHEPAQPLLAEGNTKA